MDALKKKGIIIFAITAICGLALAQVGSFLIDKNLPLYESVSLTSFLKLTHVRNMGGIFGVFQGKGWVFTAFSSVFLTMLVVWVIRDQKLRIFEYFCCGFILAGGTSNVLDRVIYGSVIDFIDVRGIPGWNYVFNTADTLIHLGIWPWIILGFLANRAVSEAQESKELASE